MKRTTKALTAAIAVCMICGSAAGCSKSKKDSIEGTYTAEWDCTDQFMDKIEVSCDTDAELVLKAELVLEDGEYTLTGDKDDFYDQMIAFLLDDDIKGELLVKFGLGGYNDSELDQMAVAQGYSDFDEMWESAMLSGISVDDWDMNGSGTYEVDDDTITFIKDDTGEEREYEIDDGNIIMVNEDLNVEMVFSK